MKRITAILLSTALICAAAAGCSDSSSSEEKSSADKVSTAASEAATSQTEKPSETSTASSAENSSVSENAVVSVTICGHDIHYPMTLGELGDDFTLDLWNSAVSGDEIMCTINYKDEHIGAVTLKGVDSEDKVNENTYISSFEVSAKDYDFEEVPISVNGIVLGDSRDKVIEELGECTSNTKHSDVYRVKNEPPIIMIIGYSDDGEIKDISLDWD